MEATAAWPQFLAEAYSRVSLPSRGGVPLPEHPGLLSWLERYLGKSASDSQKGSLGSLGGPFLDSANG